jgi:hypothetical protein
VTVTRTDARTVVLKGTCAADEAEVLLQLLVDTPAASVDWRQCEQLHTAVVQVILAGKPRLIGPCGDAWVEKWLVARPAPTPGTAI